MREIQRVVIPSKITLLPHQIVVPTIIYNLSDCPTTPYQPPNMRCLDYFLLEYARALRVDMIRFPDKYGNVPIKTIYYRMARAICDNDFSMVSGAIKHACRAANIPLIKNWIKSYIWSDYPIPKRFVKPRKITARKTTNDI